MSKTLKDILEETPVKHLPLYESLPKFLEIYSREHGEFDTTKAESFDKLEQIMSLCTTNHRLYETIPNFIHALKEFYLN